MNTISAIYKQRWDREVAKHTERANHTAVDAEIRLVEMEKLTHEEQRIIAAVIAPGAGDECTELLSFALNVPVNAVKAAIDRCQSILDMCAGPKGEDSEHRH